MNTTKTCKLHKLYPRCISYYIKNGIEPDNIGLEFITIYDDTNANDSDLADCPKITVGENGEY